MDRARGWLGPAAVVAFAGVLVAVVLGVPDVHDAARHAIAGDTTALRRDLRAHGVLSVLVLLALMLLHVVVWFPAEIVMAAAGFVYGFWIALPLMLAGWLLSALASYALGRFAGRPLLHRLAGAARFERAEAAVVRGGWPVLVAARLVPIVPFTLTGLVAGAARVRLWRFAWTTVVGYVPLCAIVTLLGSRLESLSLGDPLLWAALAPVALMLLASRPLARRLRVDER